MADAVASLKVMISGSAAGLTQSTTAASAAVEKMGSKVDTSMASVAKRAGAMGDLGDAMGRLRSGDAVGAVEKIARSLDDLGVSSKLTAKLLPAAVGATVGAMAVGAFSQLSGQAATLVQQLREGAISSNELAMGIGKSIPVFGSAVSMVENFDHIINGVPIKWAAFNKEIEATQQMLDAASKSVTDGLLSTMDRTQQRWEKLRVAQESVKDAATGKKFELKFGINRESRQEIDAYMSSIFDTRQADELRAKIAEMQKAVASSKFDKGAQDALLQLNGQLASLERARASLAGGMNAEQLKEAAESVQRATDAATKLERLEKLPLQLRMALKSIEAMGQQSMKQIDADAAKAADAAASKTGGLMDWLAEKAQGVGAAMSDAFLTAAKDMASEGQRVFDATRTDAEKLAAEMDRLNKLRNAGAIDAETFQRGAAQAQDRFGPKSAAERSAPQSPSFITSGSREASNLIANMLNEKAAGGIQDKQLAEQKKGTEAQKKTASAMENLVTAIKERPWGLAGI